MMVGMKAITLIETDSPLYLKRLVREINTDTVNVYVSMEATGKSHAARLLGAVKYRSKENVIVVPLQGGNFHIDAEDCATAFILNTTGEIICVSRTK